jgi:hypothetical protein
MLNLTSRILQKNCSPAVEYNLYRCVFFLLLIDCFFTAKVCCNLFQDPPVVFLDNLLFCWQNFFFSGADSARLHLTQSLVHLFTAPSIPCKLDTVFKFFCSRQKKRHSFFPSSKRAFYSLCSDERYLCKQINFLYLFGK